MEFVENIVVDTYLAHRRPSTMMGRAHRSNFRQGLMELFESTHSRTSSKITQTGKRCQVDGWLKITCNFFSINPKSSTSFGRSGFQPVACIMNFTTSFLRRRTGLRRCLWNTWSQWILFKTSAYWASSDRKL